MRKEENVSPVLEDGINCMQLRAKGPLLHCGSQLLKGPGARVSKHDRHLSAD